MGQPAHADIDLGGLWGDGGRAPRLKLIAGGGHAAPPPPDPPDLDLVTTLIACFALAVIGMAAGHFLVRPMLGLP